MKKGYRIIAITLVLVLLLTGCNIAPAPTDLPTGTSGSTPSTTAAKSPQKPQQEEKLFGLLETPEAPVDVSCQYLPASVESTEDLPILKWVCLTREGTHAWTEEAFLEINQMLADRNMPFRVQFAILSAEEYPSNYNWFLSPEAQEVLKDAELIWGNFSVSEMKAYLTPITEYATDGKTPSLKNAVVHERNWLDATVNGDIYGIRTDLPSANSTGWYVAPAFMQEHGLTEADFSKNFWEMDELFADIYKNNGNQAFLLIEGGGIGTRYSVKNAVGSVSPGMSLEQTGYMYQETGSCFAIDRSSGVPIVVNKMETETLCNFWSAMIRYKQAGYAVEANGLNEPSTPIYYYLTHGDNAGESILYGNEIDRICIPVTDAIYSGSRGSASLSGVAAVSEHKEEAITLLSLIAEDEAFRNQLLFGKEGRDYTVNNGNYAIKKQENGAYYSMPYLSQYAYFTDMYGRRYLNYPSAKGTDKLQAYRDMLDSTDYSCYPILFDYSAFEDELTAISEIFNEYFRNMTAIKDGEPVLTSEGYEQMLQKFKDAGSEKIIAELQRQLDKWLAANPDWLAQYG